MIVLRLFRPGIFVLLALVSAPAPFAKAQANQRPRSPNETLKSTEVSSDRKVTFRIYAPKASEVSVGGDFGEGGQACQGRTGRLVDHRRPAGARLLQLHVQRGRRPDRRPEEPD